MLAAEEARRENHVIGIHHPAENPDLDFFSHGIDLRDRAKLRDLLAAYCPARVFHLAAISSVRACQENPGLCFDTNVTGTLNLLDIIAELSLDIIAELSHKPRILLASSCEVYGSVEEKSLPLNEDSPAVPINIYGLSKLKAEEICEFYVRRSNLDIMVSRGFNHTGPGQAQRFVFPHVAHTLARIEAGKEEPVLKLGNLSVKRDILDVRDVIRAYGAIMDKGKTGSIYNVASGQCISIEEGVKLLVEISGLRITIIQEKSRMRSYDIPALSGDASRAERELGWRAEITLAETFANLLRYWREKEGL